MLARLADKLVLKPTRDRIDAEGKSRRGVDIAGGRFEIWTERSQRDGARPTDMFVLKFPGTGGRAERATLHPAECWPDLCIEVWAVNPLGYGGSSGRASLQSMPQMATAAFDAVAREAGDRPILVVGNSLGTVSALLVASTQDVAGVILRNPPPLRELVVGRFGWWNLNLAARLMASQVPHALDSVGNATGCDAPAVFVSSARDRIVPSRYQQLIIESYRGPARVLTLKLADHACPLNESEQREYGEQIAWLRSQLPTATDRACSELSQPHPRRSA